MADNQEHESSPRATYVGAAAFGLVVIAYVVMAAMHLDTEGLVRSAVLLFGVMGLGAYNRALTSEQNRRLKKHDAKLDRITSQTNGVLDQKIREGAEEAAKRAVRAVLGEHATNALPPPRSPALDGTPPPSHRAEPPSQPPVI